MAIAIIAHTFAGSANGNDVTTSAIDTTGATLLVIAVSWYTVDGGVLTDSKSQSSWTSLTQQTSSTFNASRLFYSANPTVGAGHTFTFTQSASYPSIYVLACSGVAVSSPFDVENGATGGTNALPTGSVTPGVDNEILVSGYSTFSTTATITIDSGFTVADSSPNVGSVHLGGGLAYLIQTTAGVVNPTWSQAIAAVPAATIATFKAGVADLTISLIEPSLSTSNF